MKAVINNFSEAHWVGSLRNDKDQIVGSTIVYVTEQEAIEGVKRNFPAFNIEGDDTLPEGLGDDSDVCPRCGEEPHPDKTLYQGYCEPCYSEISPT